MIAGRGINLQLATIIMALVFAIIFKISFSSFFLYFSLIRYQ